MNWIKGVFSAITGIFSGVSSWVKIIVALIAAFKAVSVAIKESKESGRRQSFNEGVAEKDTKKVEDSFNSPLAGKPSGNDVEVWDE